MSTATHRAFTVIATLAALACIPASRRALAQPAPGMAKPDGLFVPDAAVPFLSYESAWPDRLSPDGANARGLVLPVEPSNDHWQGGHVGSSIRRTRPDLAALDALTSWLGEGQGRSYEFEGRGSFIIRFPDAPEGRARRASAARYLQFVSGEAHGRDAAALQRTWFALYEPLSGATPRGVALFMPGLFGTPPGTVEVNIKRLRERGWAVLRMLSQPSRFTEDVRFEIDTREPFEAAAERIAAVFTGRTAECAYAVEAVFGAVESDRPELARLPRVAVGYSAGAMSMATVVARDPERYAAVVMVGGGADFWLINDRSNYSSWVNAVSVEWVGGEPTGAERRRLDEAYIKAAPLDSFHTAKVLRGKRVLMIQASNDLAVPSALGDVLWERSGRPERWVRPGGHETLFLGLPRDMEPMMDWLDSAAPSEQNTGGDSTER